MDKTTESEFPRSARLARLRARWRYCSPLAEGLRARKPVAAFWCADYKGEFHLGNGRYCYSLTVTDHASRYLLPCEALESTRERLTITAFERLFRERGLPQAIRSDNVLGTGLHPYS